MDTKLSRRLETRRGLSKLLALRMTLTLCGLMDPKQSGGRLLAPCLDLKLGRRQDTTTSLRKLLVVILDLK
jgi:hypothetical protein